MTDLRELIQNEYSGLSLDISAEQIISIYKKQRRKKATALTSAAICCLVMISVLARSNPQAVEEFMMTTGKMLGSFFAGNVDWTELSLPDVDHNDNDVKSLTDKPGSDATKPAATSPDKSVKSVKQAENDEESNTEPTTVQPQRVYAANISQTNPGENAGEEATEEITQETSAPYNNDNNETEAPTEKQTQPPATKSVKPTNPVKPTKPVAVIEKTQPATERETEIVTAPVTTAIPTFAQVTTAYTEPSENTEPTVEATSTEATEIASSTIPTESTTAKATETDAQDTTQALTDASEDSANLDTAIIKYVLISDTEIRITSCIPTSNSLVIPETVDGYTVREIDNGIFKGYKTLEEVELPDTLTVIGDEAFKDLSTLKRIKMSAQIKEIGRSAFEGCTSLESIDLNNVEKIDNRAFVNCVSLTTVTVPSSASTIGQSAFASCNRLKTVYLNADYEKITTMDCAYTFRNCKMLERLVVGEGVTRISEYSFTGCTALKNIEFPCTLKTIYNYAFYGCTGLETVTLPEGLESIYGNAFGKCSSLSELNLPESLKTVRSYAFYNCNRLKTVTIPKGTGTLESCCFGYYNTSIEDELKVHGFTIRGYDPSGAWNYAYYNGFAFERIGEAPGNTSIELETYFALLSEGDSFEIKYAVEFPEGDTEFTSSDPEVASVDENGVITALGHGTATINVTNNNVTRQFIVIVQ